MELEIRGIGIIESSTIKIDGLTVLTGENNSGKSTVGKVAYSLINAVSKIDSKYSRDKASYLVDLLDRISEILDIPFALRRMDNETDSAFITQFIMRRYKKRTWDTDEVEEFFYKIFNTLQTDELEQYLKDEKSKTNALTAELHMRILSEDFADKKRRAIAVCQKAIDVLHSDNFLTKYSRESIERTLLKEFNQQIQPVNEQEMFSEINVKNNNETCFKIEIYDNKIVTSDTPCFYFSPFDSVIFIDDESALDKMDMDRIFFMDPYSSELSSVLNSRKVLNHQDHLVSILNQDQDTSIIEEYEMKETISNVLAKLDNVAPGNIVHLREGMYYVNNDFKLKPSNLATGLKLFSLIKMLLLNRAIGEKSLLVLDEPEAHLHPQWQNVFAEIIALLVKELGISVLLTTHSPNFMLAIETYARKHLPFDKCNYYQAEKNDRNFVNHKLVNDDLSTIYYDFTKYFSAVKAERDAMILRAEEF